MLPPADCLVSEEVCCTSLFDIANHILAGVYESMLACYQPSFCNGGGLVAYVTMGTGDDLVYDALSVSIVDVRPSTKSVNANGMSPFQAKVITLEVRLLESGWPMAHEQNGEIYVPDPVIQNAIARHSYAHGERMYSKLTYMATHGELMPPNTVCSSAVISSLLPIPPAGGTVGWKTTVILTVPGMV